MRSDSLHRALIVVDVQNDFCPGGSLAVTNGDAVVPVLNDLIGQFLNQNEPVFASRDWHPAQTKHFAQFGGTWPVHCVQDTFGAEFHPDLNRDPRIQIISKGLGDADEYSAFDGTDLGDRLRASNVDEVWIGGLATDYCVKQTVLDARSEGFAVKAVAAAMRPVEIHPGDGGRAIMEMKAAGAEIIADIPNGQPPANDPAAASGSDPVVEAYKRDIDRTLIRHNLGLTVDQRFEQLGSLQELAEELRRSGKQHASRT